MDHLDVIAISRTPSPAFPLKSWEGRKKDCGSQDSLAIQSNWNWFLFPPLISRGGLGWGPANNQWCWSIWIISWLQQWDTQIKDQSSCLSVLAWKFKTFAKIRWITSDIEAYGSFGCNRYFKNPIPGPSPDPFGNAQGRNQGKGERKSVVCAVHELFRAIGIGSYSLTWFQGRVRVGSCEKQVMLEHMDYPHDLLKRLKTIDHTRV